MTDILSGSIGPLAYIINPKGEYHASIVFGESDSSCIIPLEKADQRNITINNISVSNVGNIDKSKAKIYKQRTGFYIQCAGYTGKYAVVEFTVGD